MPHNMHISSRVERKVKKVRIKVQGQNARPRISVFRSNRFIYSQAIDDKKRVTLAAAKGKDAKVVGAELAEKLKKAKITKAVFDRGRYNYHGNVKALADSLRENGVTI